MTSTSASPPAVVRLPDGSLLLIFPGGRQVRIAASGQVQPVSPPAGTVNG